MSTLPILEHSVVCFVRRFHRALSSVGMGRLDTKQNTNGLLAVFGMSEIRIVAFHLYCGWNEPTLFYVRIMYEAIRHTDLGGVAHTVERVLVMDTCVLHRFFHHCALTCMARLVYRPRTNDSV